MLHGEAQLSILSHVFDMKGSKYPRPGFRLAPITLNSLLATLQLPSMFRNQGYSTFADLDEGTWLRFSSANCTILGEMIIKHVASHLPKLPVDIAEKHLPLARNNVTLEQLEVETRTYNCIRRLIKGGWIRNIQDLSGFTVSATKHLKGIGAKGIVDLLVALETVSHSETKSDSPSSTTRRETSSAKVVRRLTNEAKKISKLKCSAVIRVDDPRIRKLVAPMIPDLRNMLGPLDKRTTPTLRQCAKVLYKRSFEIRNAEAHARSLYKLRRQLERMRRATLEDELKELVFLVAKDRAAAMVLRMYGWDGQGGATLQQVGDENGCTRERVRQICAPIADHLQKSYLFLPMLDRALLLSNSSTPLLAADLEEKLRSEGISKIAFRSEGLITAAEILDRPVEFELVEIEQTRVAVPRALAEKCKSVITLARRAVEHWGTSTIADLVDQMGDGHRKDISVSLVMSLLEASPDFVWLDKSNGGWFWLRSVQRNRILNQIFKILAVAPRIRLSDLRTGVSRNYRLEGFAPPRRVLAQLCKYQPGLQVDGDWVFAIVPIARSEILSGVEAVLADILLRNGPIMTRTEFEDLSVRAGINRAAFYMYLANSPILAKYAKGVYGLRGAHAEPGEIEALAPKMKPGRVLSDFGWTSDGKISLRFKVSKSMIITGNFTIPVGMRQMIERDFLLKAHDGKELGRINTRNGRGWGLAPVLKKTGVDDNDVILLLFDLQTREAIMSFEDDIQCDESDPQSVTAPGPYPLAGCQS